MCCDAAEGGDNLLQTLLTAIVAGLIWVYYQCAFFMVHLAALLDVTYRDTNAVMFFILWPTLTLGLILWVMWNQWALFRAQPRPEPSSNTPAAPS
jgi:hypothetical protein